MRPRESNPSDPLDRPDAHERPPASDSLSVIAELEAALEARDAFLRIASHDLRGPLAAIQLQADSIAHLAAQGGTQPTIDERARRVGRLVQRLARLLEDVLDVSRASSGRLVLQPREMDLAAVVREEVERLREDRQCPGCTVELRGAQSLPGTWDSSRLARVIGTLLLASARASEGGAILAEVAATDEGVHFAVESPSGFEHPPWSRDAQTFAEAAKGDNVGASGFALWLARVIVEQHGGRLELGEAGASLALPHRDAESSAADH